MLSYQHIFHAGNHADLLKHYVLFQVLKSLCKKEKPFTFYDTHSGSGLYDLLDSRSLKTGEAEKGIILLMQKMETLSAENKSERFSEYLTFLKSYTAKNLYPGSPEIEKSLMRNQDFLILSELHPQEMENLKKNIIQKADDPKIQIHKRSGWEMLNALTPPATKRGAVLIDPSYEETADYIDAEKTICEVHRKWSNGIIMLWYPLLAHRESEIKVMIDNICSSAKKINANIEISDFNLCVYSKEEKNLPRLYGSGMLVLNSPWKLKEETEAAIQIFKNAVSLQLQMEDKA
ncbi:MAG: 23S rRNA (adenine(2030)-N(6))-methyltransferase RlmJ [Treponema sp.]|nr:23S rRNA (adenine(2030)-N(6))-methyltransferase RlmJ [Treponema sp.]